MKKNKFTEFFKAKGYYVLLFVGVIAIAAVALIGSNLSSKNDENNNSVDLNEPDNNIAAGEDQNQVADNNNQVSNEVANNEQGGNKTGDTATNENAGQSTADNTAGSEDPIELEDYAQGGDNTDVAQAADTTEETAEEEEPAAVETSGKTVQAQNNPVLDDLSFNKDDGLLWPIKGNVIMNYSMDHTIYHATLMLYKVNPAIIIDAEVGEEVKAAAKGVVTSIEEDNDETGCTVTTSIGDGYSLVYGQLDGEALDLEVGDTVDAGDVIGLIAEPTEYYTVEGSNLYFEVLENDQTVNPMSLLK